MATVVAFHEDVEADRAVLGGKGLSLVEMTRLGLPVPPGFVFGTDVGRDWLQARSLPDDVLAALDERCEELQDAIGRRFGDPTDPLLVSVRSGAPVSMPGMMDTVLNVGLTDAVVAALAEQDASFAWRSYARLLESFATTVRGISAADVDDALFDAEKGPEGESKALLNVIAEAGEPFPQDPAVQVRDCLEAVFASWESPRAQRYREHRGIDASLGTAAVVQAMVFGNRGASSGSGVAFSRDPATGAPGVYGDILFDAQGEDVVAGTADPDPIAVLEEADPEIYAELTRCLADLERKERDLVECEFTIEDGRLWVLQYRAAQRSGRAAVRVAVDLVSEGVIDQEQAVAMVSEEQLIAARAPRFAEEATQDVLAMGSAASPGIGIGKAVFTADDAHQRGEAGEEVVLVRPTTSPSDIHGFIASVAIVTGRGGRTSHAAVVARGMDRPAVCGVGEVKVSADRQSATLDGVTINAGDPLAVDGDRGLVSRSAPPLVDAGQDEHLQTLEGWRTEG